MSEVFVNVLRNVHRVLTEQEQDLVVDLVLQLIGAETVHDNLFTMPYVLPDNDIRQAFLEAAEILLETHNFTTARLRTSRS